MPSNFIGNYFGFNKQQRRGLLVLVCISFVLFVVRISFPFFISPDPIEVKQLALYEQKLGSATQVTTKQAAHNTTRVNSSSPGTLFLFDPNTVSSEEMLQLGFPVKTAAILIKFRNKGFVFKTKQDLKKVYGVNEALYNRLEPYIELEQKTKALVAVPVKTTAPQVIAILEVVTIELNTCDSIALVKLPGIGPAFAKRILAYRELLGGYVAITQLKEVYGFTEDMFTKLNNSVSVKTQVFRKIDLNADDFKTVNKHPYISYELTKSIFNLRRKTPITPLNFRELIHDEALYASILPYLAFPAKN